MTDAREPNKIVQISDRLEPTAERGGQLSHAVRDISSRRLQQLLGNMFDHVDDALFDLAEKAENNAAQMHYFDGMREVRKRRPAIERSYLSLVTRSLSDLTIGQRATPVEPPSPHLGSLELSLVADNELEESLAITSMISKNESRLARDLYSLNQRLAVIYGGLKIDDASNPLGPAALSQAFRQAMRELPAEMRVKLIIYKLFDRYVMSGVDELYQAINEALSQAGVLPQLRPSVNRSGTSASAPAASGAGVGEPVQASAQPGLSAGAQDEATAQLLHTLQSLFSARRGPTRSSVSSGGEPAQPMPTAHELLGALSVLQGQIVSEQQNAAFGTPVNAQTLATEVAQLKDHLLNQIGALRGQRPHQVASVDEDTIDLVGMLFEFILADHNLPAEMQVMLARLQIPYLKASILDRRLFAQRQHPARQLLDALAEAAKGWSPEADRDRRLIDKVKSIVGRLLHDFDDDLGIFQRLLEELQDFQDINRRRAELAEQRVAESTRGREKLELARRRAAQEILDRIGGRALPPLIHGVLARAWANHLVLTLLRKGEASPEFGDALRFIGDFIDSTEMGKDAESRRALRQLLPGIERSLRRGLANVAFQDSDTEKLLGRLHTYYRQQLGEVLSPEVIAAQEAVPLPIPENMPSIVDTMEPDADEIEEEEHLAPIDREMLDQVTAMKPGVWVQFDSEDGTSERAKLSWISPMSGRYLFVNRRGLKSGDYAPHELAAALTAGRAIALASDALIDRALGAIVGRLSQSAGAAPPPA